MLINCAAYENGKKVEDLPIERIGEYSGRQGAFVWVALRDPTAEELQAAQRAFDLHELAVEDALNGEQRPKIEDYGDSLFVVMRLIDRKDEEISIGEVAVFVGPQHVISVRSRSDQEFHDVRERCEREPHLLKQGPSFVLYALMDAVVDRYFPLIDALETELDRIEERIFGAGMGRHNIQRLYALKHKAGVLRHAVVPLMEVVGNLHGSRTPGVCVDTQAYFRDVADHLTRISASIDTIRDTIGTAVAANLSMVTIEESEVTKRLAAWAAIFGLATFFAGVWGMNFQHMPELKLTWGYPMALAVIGVTCGYLWWRFRRAGWL